MINQIVVIAVILVGLFGILALDRDQKKPAVVKIKRKK